MRIGLRTLMGVLALGLASAPAFALTAAQIDANGFHACAVTGGGGLWCWGWNLFGQLGDGGTANRAEPAPVTGLAKGVAAVALNSRSSCALLKNGTVKCWGDNYEGQLGDGSDVPHPLPTPVQGLPGPVVALAAGDFHVCALIGSGEVWCWGWNTFGQLGRLTQQRHEPPAPVVGLPPAVVAIAAGMANTCAITQTGALWCWGRNESGQLGDGSPEPSRTAPGPVPELSDVASVDIGSEHVCASTRAGVLWCWGSNGVGQLADAPPGGSAVPFAVSGVSGVRSIALGPDYSCAADGEGVAWCWGSDGTFQLGRGGSGGPWDVPQEVIGSFEAEVQALAAGNLSACALLEGGGIRCWGHNHVGELGDGLLPTPSGPTPVQVAGLSSGVTAISQGAGSTCAVRSDGSVVCWGTDWMEVADEGETSAPVVVHEPPDPAVAVSRNCLIMNGGLAGCWNPPARFGMPVPGMSSGVQAISSGLQHRCAIVSTGGVRCWGTNFYGELGAGSSVSFSSQPLNVVGLASGVDAISAGFAHSCAATSAGAARCWGANWNGQLGDGSTAQRLAPVVVQGLGNWVADVSAGMHHSCARTAFGVVVCWGSNGAGQLGDGTQTERHAPVSVNGLGTGVQRVSAGGLHTCALTGAGGVVCWGANYSGELGAGIPGGASLLPVAVAGLESPVLDVSANEAHTCALTAAGAVLCWGTNELGQLGDGTRPFSRIAVPVHGFEAGATVPALGAPALALLAAALLGAGRVLRRRA